MALLLIDLDKHIGNARAWRDKMTDQYEESLEES